MKNEKNSYKILIKGGPKFITELILTQFPEATRIEDIEGQVIIEITGTGRAENLLNLLEVLVKNYKVEITIS